MVERFHRRRFFLVESALFRYLMLKLTIFAGRLLCDLDHNKFSFWKEMMKEETYDESL